jgi:branched-chain amino acid transport system substrate-binding protein
MDLRVCLRPLAFSVLLSISLGGTIATKASAEVESKPESLRLGLIFDFTGALAEHGVAARRGAELAARDINRGGGVFGRPIELVFADGATNPEVAVVAARRLVAEDKVHALVGPMGSGSTLAVARQIGIPSRIPVISPSATAPDLTWLQDDDFIFRTTASDAAQGPVLAQLIKADGYESVAVIYREGPYGRGLFKAFSDSYSGAIKSVVVDGDHDSYLDQLKTVVGPPVLIVLTYPEEAELQVREALEHQLFTRFVFADATRTPELMKRVDAVALEGVKGTSPALRDGVSQPSTLAFVASFREEFGSLPIFGPGSSVYDAVVCLSLAAQRSGRNDGVGLRDALRPVCGAPGKTFIASPTSVAAALKAAADQEDINYEGAGGTVDWNQAGDIRNGFVDIWQFTKGSIVSLQLVPFDLGE